jgi:antitoxin FitA
MKPSNIRFLLGDTIRYRDIIRLMSQLVVRNLEDGVKDSLQRRAKRHGRSMEEEVRHILRDVAREDHSGARKLGTRIAARFRGAGLTDELPEFHGEAPRPARFDR